MSKTWSSPISSAIPPIPNNMHWALGVFCATIILASATYGFIDKGVPIDDNSNAEVETIIVSLGAPAQRLEPPPVMPEPEIPPEPEPQPLVKTERAEEAPPPKPPETPRRPPIVQPEPGPLSSGFTEAPVVPPPTLDQHFIDISMHAYISRVNYPYNALRNRVQGVGMIRVTIDRKGNVTSWEFTKSSGSQILDKEISRVASKVKKLDPLPDNYPFPRARLIIPFSFVLTN